MKFTTPTLAVALAVPAITQGYSLGRFYAPTSRRSSCAPGARCGPEGFGLITPADMMALQRRRRDAFRNAFQSFSPGYQIVDDDEKFQVQIDVPGVRAEDINVNLEEDGKVLTLSGSRERTKEGGSYSTKFSQSFYLDPTVDADSFSANLENGVLIVSAPKNIEKIEKAIRKIPITEMSAEEVVIPTDVAEAPKAEESLEEAEETVGKTEKDDESSGSEAEETI